MTDPFDSAIPVGSGSGQTVPPSTPPPPAPPTARATPSGSEKIWALLSHLSSFIGVPIILPLVVYLAMRDDSVYVRENAKEALNFHLSLLIYGLGCVLLAITIVGAPLAAIVGVAIAVGGFILSIVAAIQASEGGVYRYPLTIRLVG